MKKHAMCSVLQSKKHSIGEHEFIESQNESTANSELTAQQQKAPTQQQEAPIAQQQEAPAVQQKAPADVPEPVKKQRKPIAVRILLVILYVLLGIIALVLLYVGFSAIDRRNPDQAVAPDFALYANISSVYKVAKPIADSPSFEALLKEKIGRA